MRYEQVGILPCDLLLPAEHVKNATWACVACDQYTSQPEYWRETAALVGEAPSCSKLVLPECFLAETARLVPAIHAEMEKYLADGTLETRVREGFVLLERTTELSAQKRFATSVTIILPLSAVSAAVYLLRGGAFAAQAVPYLVGGAAGGVLAGAVLKKLPTKLLRVVFALFLVWGGVRLLLR